jgi:putative hydrolase of the HAD superfamily
MLACIDCRIDDFMARKINLEREELTRLRTSYLQKYGTTLAGLFINHQVEPAEYIEFIYQINISDFLQPDSRLAKVLESVPLTKVVFSNSPAGYIRKVLGVLGVEKFFAKIYDIEFCGYMGKPNLSSFQKVLNDLGADGEECILVDDCLANLQAAREIKIVPIYINRDPQQSIPWQIQEIYEIAETIQKITKSGMSEAV